MISHHILLLAVLKVASWNVEALSMPNSGRCVSRPCAISHRGGFSRLYAEEPETGSGGGGATDILNSPAFLRRKIDVLKSDIDQVDEEIALLTRAVEEGKAEWGEQLAKLQDEYSTIQQRLGNQNKQGDTIAVVQVVREMLGVLDNFDRAFGAVKAESEEDQAIKSEYKATYDQILDIFQELGVTTVETVGKEFDYKVHQAVMQKPSDEYEEGVCSEEFAKGFIMGDTLIRAAMVAVAA